ncbi:MAG: zinc-binding dehydrogenase [Armatimonadetes bacterium]|nr:zinc-binding dehydrogenase [Armatimonadota bacterium]
MTGNSSPAAMRYDTGGSDGVEGCAGDGNAGEEDGMQVAAVLGERRGGGVEKPDPRPQEEFVVVKVHSAPMCTEYTAFMNGSVTDGLGHEAAGEVVSVDRSDRVRIGDRVVVMPQYPCGHCFLCEAGDYIHCEHNRDIKSIMGESAATATMAQYLVKPDALLVPIPDGMSYDHASMACCGLGPTFGALWLMDAGPGETVLIVGLGPVGLGGVVNAVHRGCRVIGVDREPYRLELARALGADAVVTAGELKENVEQIRDLTGGRGADLAIKCTAAPGAERLAIEATRRKGQVSFIGWGGEISVNTIISKGLRLHGAWHYNLSDAPELRAL